MSIIEAPGRYCPGGFADPNEALKPRPGGNYVDLDRCGCCPINECGEKGVIIGPRGTRFYQDRKGENLPVSTTGWVRFRPEGERNGFGLVPVRVEPSKINSDSSDSRESQGLLLYWDPDQNLEGGSFR